MKTKTDVNYKSLDNLTDEQMTAFKSIGSALLSIGFIGGAACTIVGTGVIYGVSALVEKAANKMLNKKIE